MLNEKSFNGAIATIKKSGEKLAQAIHDASVFAIAQANEHGNIGFAVRLIDAMGKKHDRQRVVNHLVAFGKIGVTKGEIVFRKRKDILPENLDAWTAKAEATPYWELTKEKPLVEKVDYLSMLSNMLNKHDKTIPAKVAAGEQVDESNVAVLAEVRKIVERMKKPAIPEVHPVAV